MPWLFWQKIPVNWALVPEDKISIVSPEISVVPVPQICVATPVAKKESVAVGAVLIVSLTWLPWQLQLWHQLLERRLGLDLQRRH